MPNFGLYDVNAQKSEIQYLHSTVKSILEEAREMRTGYAMENYVVDGQLTPVMRVFGFKKSMYIAIHPRYSNPMYIGTLREGHNSKSNTFSVMKSLYYLKLKKLSDKTAQEVYLFLKNCKNVSKTE